MLEGVFRLPQTAEELFVLVITLVCPLCAVSIFSAIFINFVEARHAGQVAKEHKSVVATGSMVLFFVGFYLVIHEKIGVAPHLPARYAYPMMAVGAVLVILGTVVNILGRLRLGRNWANQATLYEDQTLVTTGVYGIVRHPLYASLVWIFFGASLIYRNYAALLVNALIFIPAMYYRAGLEEQLLQQRFPAYAAYRRRVGTLFPQLFRRSSCESM